MNNHQHHDPGPWGRWFQVSCEFFRWQLSWGVSLWSRVVDKLGRHNALMSVADSEVGCASASALTNASLHKHSGGADVYFQSYFRPNHQPTTYEPRALSSALASLQLSSIHLPPGCESWAPLTRLRQYTSLFEPWRKLFSHADEKPQSKKNKKWTRMFFFIFSAHLKWQNLWLLPASSTVPF